MTPFETYQLYNALRLHFTTKYDFFKYGGRTRVTKESFDRSKHRFQFVGLNRKYGDNIKDFLVANFVEDQIKWVGNLDEKNYEKWRNKQEKLAYIFQMDCDVIKQYGSEKGMSFDEFFKSKDQQHPLLLKLYYQQKITLETLVIINKLLSFAHQWDEQLNHDVLWNDTQRRMLKYEPFLKINKKQFKSLMKETFKC